MEDSWNRGSDGREWWGDDGGDKGAGMGRFSYEKPACAFLKTSRARGRGEKHRRREVKGDIMVRVRGSGSGASGGAR